MPEGRDGSGARLRSMERRKFRDDLHSADEGDRLHNVSDVAAEPCFRRETRLAALVASEAHDRSFAIVGCEAVDRWKGQTDRDRSERPGGRRDGFPIPRMEPPPARDPHVEIAPE